MAKDNNSLSNLSDIFNNSNVNKALDEFGKQLSGSMTSMNPMRTNISENDKEYKVSAELPGFKKNNISIHYNGGNLTITAHHESSNEDRNSNDHVMRRERSTQDAKRSFYLPNVNMNDSDAFHATYDGGVLRMVLPKKRANNNNSIHID